MGDELAKKFGMPTSSGIMGAVGGMFGGKMMPTGQGGNYSSSLPTGGTAGPERESLRDETGALKKEFTYDPTKSAAFGKLQEQAMAAPGESPWAKMQLQKQGLEQAGAAESAAKASASGLAQAQGNLMRQGGLGGGARTRMAMQGARDLSGAQQGVNMAGMKDRLGIQGQDIDRQQSALGNISATELEGQGKNLGTLMGDVTNKGLFDMEKYKKQMEVLAAGRTADAQTNAANNSGKK